MQLISGISSEDSSLPSTPTSKRLSWSKIMQKLHNNQSLDSDSDTHSSLDDASDAGNYHVHDLAALFQL